MPQPSTTDVKECFGNNPRLNACLGFCLIVVATGFIYFGYILAHHALISGIVFVVVGAIGVNGGVLHIISRKKAGVIVTDTEVIEKFFLRNKRLKLNEITAIRLQSDSVLMPMSGGLVWSIYFTRFNSEAQIMRFMHVVRSRSGCAQK